MTDAIHYLGLLEISERIRRREITSLAVTQALLARIERDDRRLHSSAMVLTEQALAEARRADAELAAGFVRGPLHGVPVAIKDLLWTRGLPTAAGMDVLKDFRPEADATVVSRLRTAGAVLIAKLQMTEGATLSHHPNVPRPANPWSAAHWTGVSSSGSGVAPAAGLCFGALGTDTGGSIRVPSAANNLSGIKPTWGRVSRHGLMPLAPSLDHIGPMARSVADAAAILQAIAGPDPADPTALTAPVPDYLAPLTPISDLVIGVDRAFATDDVPAPIVRAFETALETFAALGARIRPIEFPVDAAEQSAAAPLLLAELAAAHADHFPGLAEGYGPRLRAMLSVAQAVGGPTVARAYQAKDRFTGRLAALFRDVDLILLPGLGRLVPTWDEVDAWPEDVGPAIEGLFRFAAPFNLAGTPTLSFPGGFTDDGLPIGLQLVGWKLAEPALIRAGRAFQCATDFHTRRPPLED
jgi:amidase